MLNPEIAKQGLNIRSIIKDWARLRDWELNILVLKGYEDAIKERERRQAESATIQHH